MHTIGKLAQFAEVTTDTVRYYEKEGLLLSVKKTDAGYRLYDEDSVRRLRFIRQAQKSGFSLTEIRELLALKNSDAACCSDVRSVAIEKKLQLEHKIRALQVMSRALTELVTICDDESKPLDECPILAALETSMIKKMK
ncbi:MAG: heavy metal-responsive transcriptional regulator [Gallionellales bacterium 35-53-114]|nr:MAG: heavy metal-responsive transcriptional regulator [Gallionellales bacterium 35-53-114]OYZ64942.1 MAG: heavy metal-responsive transcriptional regulator [Gallionellales bacterium 24-53-125]OZB07520.1 MAG: heavy metal-responsive transcriptional regulator [Gallionellales bacterium 39-52-133]HQS58808.1 heavy metal-responsive transcriptional regulator [Gallionellaceae bacterium]HQS75149.1 heavy metal-responsive transcriptional regulator [Gallionellaceae bacterium]